MSFLLAVVGLTSCIEPPLKLPAEVIGMNVPPLILLDLDVVWNIDVDWRKHWYYGWDELDRQLWGEIDYPMPTSYELRRYYQGDTPGRPHRAPDEYTIFGTRFRRTYNFGYYDMLIWSNIDSEDGTQVVTIDERDYDNVTASTTVTRGMTRVSTATTVTTGTTVLTGTSGSTTVTGLFNQPEIFYSDDVRDVFVSQNPEDYDYYDEVEKCWIKHLNSELEPLVYIYLVQVILYNNNGRIRGCTGDNALSSLASGTSVNTGHTWDRPVLVYYGSRFKQDIDVRGRQADIIGGKLTTYGLCDMDSYGATRYSSQYTGTRTDLTNFLYVDVVFANGVTSTLQVDVTDQCQAQAHGGVITVEIDVNDIEIPTPPTSGSGSLFVPTVEDYEEVIFDIQM